MGIGRKFAGMERRSEKERDIVGKLELRLSFLSLLWHVEFSYYKAASPSQMLKGSSGGTWKLIQVVSSSDSLHPSLALSQMYIRLPFPWK